MEILLAEDERVIRRSLNGLLEANGYVVRAAADGEAALRLYRERRSGLMLLDVMMPRRNGHGVCAAIRETDVSTPVLFLTAAPTALEGRRKTTCHSDGAHGLRAEVV